MPAPVKLSKADARRALIRHHFAPAPNIEAVFDRLRSIQFDPIAPVGCNHDLVLQARLDNYQIGDWETHAYDERKIYDGWDKMASLVPYEGWPLRRIFHDVYRRRNPKVFLEHPDAMETILREIEARGPLMPRECEFQAQRPDWKDSWHGSSVTKQALRALWHSGQVMTTGRRKGQHLYDLTERVVPPHLLSQPLLTEKEAVQELVLERHRAVGLLRPSAPYEVWSYFIMVPERKVAIARLIEEGHLVSVDVDGVTAHATPELLTLLDQPSLDPGVTFIAPLDPFMWDRKMIAHLFDFDYVWEIYTPEPKRRWGYYVLPIRYGNHLVARAEFWARNGVLELRRWHAEVEAAPTSFRDALTPALERFMTYCRATEIQAAPDLPHLLN